MIDAARVLHAIELAERTTRWCAFCGEPTVVVSRDDGIWLECSFLQRERTGLTRLLALGSSALHSRRHITDPVE